MFIPSVLTTIQLNFKISEIKEI